MQEAYSERTLSFPRGIGYDRVRQPLSGDRSASRPGRAMRGWPVALSLGALVVGFAVGRFGAPASAGPGAALPGPALLNTVLPGPGDRAQAAAQAPTDPRELIPLVPGPGDRPGPGAPQPRPAPGEGECTVLMFRDGQFYRMQPGGPLPGVPQPGGDRSGDDGELFPLQPPQRPAPGPGFPGPTPDLAPFPAPELRS